MIIVTIGTLAALFLLLAIIAESQRRLAEKRLDQAILISEKMLFDIDERLRRVSGTSHIRKEIAQEVGQMLETLKTEALSNQELRYKQLITHQLRGNVALRNDNRKLAENEFKKALHVAQELLKETPRAESGLHGVAEVAGGLAEIAMERSQYKIAESFYRLRYETIRKLLSTVLEDPGYLRLHARALAELGLLEAKQFSKANEQYVRLKRDVESLIQLGPLGQESLMVATDAFIVLGEHARSSNEMAQAEASFKAALKLALQRKEIDPDTIDAEYDILQGHSNLILVQLAKNDTGAMRLHLNQAKSAFKIVSGSERFRNDEQLPQIRSLIHEVQLILDSY